MTIVSFCRWQSTCIQSTSFYCSAKQLWIAWYFNLGYMLCSKIISKLFNIFLQYWISSTYSFSKSPSFVSRSSSYLRAFSSSSSGSFTPVYRSGNFYERYNNLLREYDDSNQSTKIVLFYTGGHTHFLTCHRHMLLYGTPSLTVPEASHSHCAIGKFLTS